MRTEDAHVHFRFRHELDGVAHQHAVGTARDGALSARVDVDAQRRLPVRASPKHNLPDPTLEIQRPKNDRSILVPRQQVRRAHEPHTHDDADFGIVVVVLRANRRRPARDVPIRRPHHHDRPSRVPGERDEIITIARDSTESVHARVHRAFDHLRRVAVVAVAATPKLQRPILPLRHPHRSRRRRRVTGRPDRDVAHGEHARRGRVRLSSSDCAARRRVPRHDDAVGVAGLERARAATGVERRALRVRRVRAQNDGIGRGIRRHGVTRATRRLEKGATAKLRKQSWN